MRLTPKTDQEIMEENLLPEGIYPFTIKRAIDDESKKGNDMIVLTLQISNDNGKSYLVTDYLLEIMAKKLKDCCRVCGLVDKYEAGSIEASDFIEKTGEVFLKIKPEGAYPAKNVVSYYITKSGTKTTKPETQAAPEYDTLDDEVPF